MTEENLMFDAGDRNRQSEVDRQLVSTVSPSLLLATADGENDAGFPVWVIIYSKG